MKSYFRRFRNLFIAVAVFLLVYIIMLAAGMGESAQYVRTNTECLTEERVFDYADKLTDEEEEALRERIAEREAIIGCDIAVLTINEPDIDTDEALIDFVEEFYETYQFGYDKPMGDGTVYVDNWYNGYTRLATWGKVKEEYYDEYAEVLVDHVTEITNENPYGAYELFVNDVYDGVGWKAFADILSWPIVFLIALLAMIIYIVIHLLTAKGKRTTTAYTYVTGGKPTVNSERDIFVSKNVTSYKIESSSSSGGGGGGHSSGGASGRH